MKPSIGRPKRFAPWRLAIVIPAALAACGGGSDGNAPASAPASAHASAHASEYVAKAHCGPNDKPETALQGQVPASMRPTGFKGFNCNLELVGQSAGDGASWQHAQFSNRDRGVPAKRCSYYDTSSNTVGRTHLGTAVIDVTDPTHPKQTASLTTTAMLDPWESLKVNERRQFLAADNGTYGGFDATTGGPQLDIYDLSGDCAYPQLLTNAAVVVPGGQNRAIVGHEGEWAPDGLTYYFGDLWNRQYTAVDTTNPMQTKYIATFKPNVAGGSVHGLSVSDDGNRAYLVSADFTGFHAGSPTPNNGLIIVDTSEVQARKANPVIREISRLFWDDGAAGQHTIITKIGGKPYVIFADETGPGGFFTISNWKQACDMSLPPFPMARIIDISDEKNPRIVSKLKLEIHNPANCSKIAPDLPGLRDYVYGTHYCSVDDMQDASILACGMFSSGIRVYDIRNPLRPKEIAYYNPPAVTSVRPGSQVNFYNGAVNPDSCSAHIYLDKAKGQLWTTCQDNGFLALKFTNGVWPFKSDGEPDE